MTVEERISRLEDENRKLTRTVVALSGAGGVAAAVGLAGSAGAAATTVVVGVSSVLLLSARAAFRVRNVVQARKFEVVNDMGQVLVALGETAEGDGAVATYSELGSHLGHVSRVDDDTIVLRKPRDNNAPAAIDPPRDPRLESSH
jgi:hypothetical protein